MRRPQLRGRDRKTPPSMFTGKTAAKPKAEYPADHQAGMQVPKGGSCCANCRFLGDDQANCTNEYFIKWNGSGTLPAAPEEYCSDWWEPKE